MKKKENSSSVDTKFSSKKRVSFRTEERKYKSVPKNRRKEPRKEQGKNEIIDHSNAGLESCTIDKVIEEGLLMAAFETLNLNSSDI